MGLQVWLPLNKDTRNNGLSNSTVINSGATLEDNGVFDKCYNITLGKYLGLDAPNVNNHKYSPISIALWVYPTLSDSTERYIIGCWESGGGGLFLKSQKVGMYAYVGGSYKICSSTTIVTLNTWHHVCSTYDNETLKLYLDGQQVATVVTYGPITYNNTTPWQIGGNPLPGEFLSGNFVGKINDVRIYDHCITPEDVKRIYNCKIMDVCASSYNGGFFYDNSGLLINDLVSTGLTFSGNSMYFNGTTTQIRPKDGTSGLNISGGTLSVWFKPLSEPSGYRIIVYIDSVSKMAIGFLNASYFLCNCNGSSYSTFSTANIQYNNLNHMVISYGSNYAPQWCYINGVKAATGSTNNWTESSGLTIGGRQYNTANKFNGYISKVTVYKNQLTEDEAKQLYTIGPQDKILPDEYVRLEYLEATGTQYINTGLKTTSEYLRIITKLKVSGYNNDIRPFGSQKKTQCTIVPWPKDSANPYGWLAIGTDYYAQTTSSNYFTTPLNKDFYMDIVANSGTVKGIYCGYNLNATYTGSLQNGYDNYIFASNRNETPQRGGTQRIYYFQMFLSENYLSFCGIPAKRKSDNVLGMYDLVSNTFFTNAGTGTFTAGPAI